MAKHQDTEVVDASVEQGNMSYPEPLEEYRLSIAIPTRVYEQLVDISDRSGVPVVDLLIASADIFFRKPTQSLMRRVLRKAQEYRVERILSAFPAPNKREKKSE